MLRSFFVAVAALFAAAMVVACNSDSTVSRADFRLFSDIALFADGGLTLDKGAPADQGAGSDLGQDCGNGSVDPNESCDTAITTGAGACPTSCTATNACQPQTLVAAGTCNARCETQPITACKNGDGCCPAGCNHQSDDDCSALCGNGQVDSGETCDTAISSGAGSCPQSCNDNNDCTNDSLVSGGTCQAVCSFVSKTTGTQCDGNTGQCLGGACCKGCRSGSSCVVGTSLGACGSGGGVCASCSTTNPCKIAKCESGGCAYQDKPTSTTCSDAGKSGFCAQGGVCCTGCIDLAGTCHPGTTIALCGIGGKTCSQCTTTAECKDASCSASGSCTTTSVPTGGACTKNNLPGKCYSNQCCTGCWDGTICRSSPAIVNTDIRCGSAGASCVNCPLSASLCCDTSVTPSKCTTNGGNGHQGNGACYP
ncbi:MAG: hypothetical protein H6707_19070 [Deltaproteobacteria bacterium]|nr:hypothetical protein [Deltaproteobacteria bacterium]